MAKKNKEKKEKKGKKGKKGKKVVEPSKAKATVFDKKFKFVKSPTQPIEPYVIPKNKGKVETSVSSADSNDCQVVGSLPAPAVSVPSVKPVRPFRHVRPFKGNRSRFQARNSNFGRGFNNANFPVFPTPGPNMNQFAMMQYAQAQAAQAYFTPFLPQPNPTNPTTPTNHSLEPRRRCLCGTRDVVDATGRVTVTPIDPYALCLSKQ